MLVAVDLSLTVALVYQGYNAMKHLPAISVTFLVVSPLYAAFLLYTVVVCYKNEKEHDQGLQGIFSRQSDLYYPIPGDHLPE
jgi:hypothetical protein